MPSRNFLYVGEALGKDLRPIKVPKIRTMYLDSDSRLTHVIHTAGLDGLGKLNKDQRVIPSRRFLRRYFIDEIPQLFYNVLLKRNMSLIGIRPKSEAYWRAYPKTHKQRALRYKPGFMGVNYAENRDYLRAERRYLARKKLAPISTDAIYFFKIAYQILFKGKRSS